MNSTINIFIGTSAGGEDIESQAVAEYTIRKHASQPVAISFIALSKDPNSFWYGWNTESWGTPFSGLRWGVPAFCSFEGKAIYLDGDIICLADIVDLWNQPIPHGSFALVKDSGKDLRSCVMLMDCAAAKKILPDINTLRRTKLQYKKVMERLRKEVGLTSPFEGMWNCVDLKESSGIDDPRIKIIHYSSQWQQPHLSYAQSRLQARGRRHWYNGKTGPHQSVELQEAFEALLLEAYEAGYTPDRYEPVKPFGKYSIRSYADRA